ncbi:hypothetical protein ACQKCU_01800 [Heyndrickxia sporothermodurans]
MLAKNQIRKWTLGEIINSIIQSGLTIERLDEEKGVDWAFPANAPENIENRLPGLYTLISKK